MNDLERAKAKVRELMKEKDKATNWADISRINREINEIQRPFLEGKE